MSETFKSQALEANLAQTRYKDIFIPEEHQHFIDLSAKYFGINKRAKECITEYHHPLSNHTFVTEELRKMLMDDFWFYTRDDIPADALHIPLEMMHSLLKPEVAAKLRLNIIITLMEFSNKVIVESPKHNDLISLVFSVLDDKFETNKDVYILATKHAGRYLNKVACDERFSSEACSLLRKMLQENYRYWQETSQVENWVEIKKTLLTEEEVKKVSEEVGKPYFEQLRADLEAADTWEKLTDMPNFEQVAKRFTESEQVFPHFITKFHYVFFLLHLPGMENQRERLIWNMDRMMRDAIDEMPQDQLIPFIDTIFDLAEELKQDYMSAVLDFQLTLGLKIIDVDQTEMKEYAYYMNSGSKVTVYCDTLEGYAASVTITAFHGGAPTTLAPGQIYEVPSGETVLDVCVKSFNGKEYSYYVYLLNGNDDGTFYEQTLIQFPQSYYSGLWLMHNLHPDYIFTPYNTGLDFQTVLNAECKNGRSLAQYSSFPTYIKDNSPVYDGTDWMAVKPEVTSYFLDPRNFLVPDRIFMFEQLSFDSDLQTIAGVRSIIAGSFLDGGDKDYAQLIYDAGESAGVSPYFLASRIIQEMGYNGESELWRGEVDGYEGYYNFYNIGAYASADGLAVTNGAKYAMWGKEPDAQEISDTEAAILLPWDTPEKAIEGGALWLASGYIEVGQNTLYFQKFDIKQDGTELYTHQYAQNIMMAYSESRRYYNSYNDIGMLDQGFEFIIPVYENMPEDYGYLP